MSDDNVIHLDARRSGRQLRGPADAANQLRLRFRREAGGQRETFIHLARHVSTLVDELKARFGERSGKMQGAFGGLLKQKVRFVLAEGKTPGTLCHNPGNWLQVLNGLANELGREPDRMLLDAFRGSPLLPGGRAEAYRRDQWLGNFQGLMESMTRRVLANVDYVAVATYLADSGLFIDGGALTLGEGQDGSIGIDQDGLYTPAALLELPHVMGLNFSGSAVEPYDVESPAFRKALTDAGLDQSQVLCGSPAVVMTGTRTALAIALNAANGEPALAIAVWKMRELVFDQGHPQERRYPINSSSVDTEGDLGNSVSFHFLGSPDFDEAVAARIVFPEIWTDREDFSLWDPGLYVDDVEGFPSEAPSRTVAAAVERNLFYAAPDNLDRRIDHLLTMQLRKMEMLVKAHRGSQATPASDAKRALLDEWVGSDNANKGTGQ